jgi:hypothetical protein
MWDSIILHLHMYTQQSPPYYIPPRTEAFLYQSYGPSPRSLVGYVGFARTFVPPPSSVPRATNLCSLLQRPTFMLTACTFCSYSRNPCQACAMNLCSSLQGHSSMLTPCTFLSVLQGPLSVHAPLHHITLNHRLTPAINLGVWISTNPLHNKNCLNTFPT